MHLNSIKIILAGYLGILFLGACILALPIMHNGSVTILDALFTSTSALTCTGLVVKNLSTDFTIYGQIVVLLLIQVGGFGYMSMVGLIYLVAGKKLSNTEKTLIKEHLSNTTVENIDTIVKKTMFFVLITETVGAVILSIHFSNFLGVKEGIWAGVFHAISSFNNSGFSIFSSNMEDYRGDILVSAMMCILICIGGLGYICSLEINEFCKQNARRFILDKKTNFRLSLNSKVILSVTAILLCSGFVMVILFEWSNDKTLGNVPLYQKIVDSMFISFNYRTAGFNTLDIGNLSDKTLFFSTLLMVIGGGPGGTASGVKVTTLAVIVALSYSIVKSRSETTLFNRSIPDEVVSKALTVSVVALVYIFTATFLLSLFEPNVGLLPILFEVTSAFSTSGLSTGSREGLSLSASFGNTGLFIIMLLMVSGKIGTLSFTLIFAGAKSTPQAKRIKERVMV